MLEHLKRRNLTKEELIASAERHGVPYEDILLIAVNLFGVSSKEGRHRARLTLNLIDAPQCFWMVIVPTNSVTSPFFLVGDQLYLGGEFLAWVRRVDADESVGGYFRNDGKAATLNPNARSRCVGCAFCPNTLEAAADPLLAKDTDIDELFSAMIEQHPRGNLAELEEITLSTGCFGTEGAAVEYVIGLRDTLERKGINARIGLLTSVIETEQAFKHLAKFASPFVFRLTAECFSRRDLLLKASKARLQRNDMPVVLKRALDAGLDTSFTYIVGLDTLDEMRAGVSDLSKYATDFPNFQIYQAHNSIMAGLRTPGAEHLDFYLRARHELEQIFKASSLRPKAWECYRPLWYYSFAGDRSN